MYYMPDGPSRASPPRAVNWPVSFAVCLGWPRSKSFLNDYDQIQLAAPKTLKGQLDLIRENPWGLAALSRVFSFPVYAGRCILYAIIFDELCQSNRVWNTFWSSRWLSQIWLEMKYENKKNLSILLCVWLLTKTPDRIWQFYKKLKLFPELWQLEKLKPKKC
jgi:hypothetical protein